MDAHILLVIPAIILIAVIIVALKEKNPTHLAVGATVVIILTGGILVPLLDDIGADTSMEYDDYVEVDADTVTGGAIELVTIGSKTYAHAADTGAGEINGKRYDVQKAQLDLFLIMGQSNAAYSYYDVATAAPVAELGTTYYFGTDTQPNTQIVTGIGMYDAVDPATGEARIGHLEMPFMAEYHAVTGHKVYTINTGWNGANISTLTVGGSHYNYEWRTARNGFSAVNQDHYTINPVGYIWIQGESDASLSTPVDEYKGAFMDLFDAISWQSSDRFTPLFKMDQAFIVQTRTVRGPNPAEALTELAEEYAGIHMATDVTLTFTVDNGMMRSDNLHYTQAAYNILGVQVARCAASIETN